MSVQWYLIFEAQSLLTNIQGGVKGQTKRFIGMLVAPIGIVTLVFGIIFIIQSTCIKIDTSHTTPVECCRNSMIIPFSVFPSGTICAASSRDKNDVLKDEEEMSTKMDFRKAVSLLLKIFKA